MDTSPGFIVFPKDVIGIVFPKDVIGVEFSYAGLNPEALMGKRIYLAWITKTFIFQDSTRNINGTILKEFKIAEVAFTDFLLRWQVTSMSKTHPNAVEYDTIRTNRWGQPYVIQDHYRILALEFPERHDVYRVVEDLRKIVEIRWVEVYRYIIIQSEPDDPDYFNGIE